MAGLGMLTSFLILEQVHSGLLRQTLVGPWGPRVSEASLANAWPVRGSIT